MAGSHERREGDQRERVREEIGRGGEAWKELGECRGDDPVRWIGPDEGLVKETAAERLVREHGAKVVCAVCEVQRSAVTGLSRTRNAASGAA
jgi:sarcosine oxidase gamma subunit